MTTYGDLEREREIMELEESHKPYKFTVRVGERIINTGDTVTVMRSSGTVERDWVFVNFDPERNMVAVRKYKIENGEKTIDCEKFPKLAKFTQWQSL